jgi:hypothetical protein
VSSKQEERVHLELAISYCSINVLEARLLDVLGSDGTTNSVQTVQSRMPQGLWILATSQTTTNSLVEGWQVQPCCTVESVPTNGARCTPSDLHAPRFWSDLQQLRTLHAGDAWSLDCVGLLSSTRIACSCSCCTVSCRSCLLCSDQEWDYDYHEVQLTRSHHAS